MKTEMTKRLENSIRELTERDNIVGVYESTFYIDKTERVDYLTYNIIDKTFTCYEIKSSVSDFNSKAKNSFVGNYNYYVLSRNIYDKVKDKIPNHIGIYVMYKCVRQAEYQEINHGDELLRSLLKSLYRDSSKLYTLGQEQYVNRLVAHSDKLFRKYNMLKSKCLGKDEKYFKETIDKIDKV